jgi:homoserine kinase type II
MAKEQEARGEGAAGLDPDTAGADGKRDRFGTHELAAVLSHYDLGVIDDIRVFARGSRRAPKVLIKTHDGGEFVLKRRAAGRDNPYRVAFAHSLQLYLADCGYPVPDLHGTRDTNNSLLQLDGRIYELFEYVAGTRDDGSPQCAAEAGRALGHLHRLLLSYKSPYDPPAGSFHAPNAVAQRLAQIPESVAAKEPQADREPLQQACRELERACSEAARRVEQAGYGSWPRTIIHGDWHPGNVIFQGGRVVAAVDFDSARLEPRVADVANAALQFGMVMTGDDPANWPVDLDVDRILRLVRGYERGASHTIGEDELAAVPWLMMEALVLETAVPISATGSFGRIRGSEFLPIRRRVRGLLWCSCCC